MAATQGAEATTLQQEAATSSPPAMCLSPITPKAIAPPQKSPFQHPRTGLGSAQPPVPCGSRRCRASSGSAPELSPSREGSFMVFLQEEAALRHGGEVEGAPRSFRASDKAPKAVGPQPL